VILRRLRVGADDAAIAALAGRALEDAPEVERAVRAIVDDVRARGDVAVREHTERFDRRAPVAGDGYEVPLARLDAALAGLDPALVDALRLAAGRIADFHRPQAVAAHAASYAIDRGQLALRAQPLARVGLYAPGGTARYPSSVLMTAIPAKLAGVGEIVLCTPGASDETLAAARLAGVDRVFELGGAQAVAAMAYGTASVPRVDKIVGPGNRWVAAAKRIVYGAVDIDSIAGPSEVLVVADASARPAWIAADLLAQAEHDVEARVVLVTTDAALLDAVDAALLAQLADLPRAAIARAALERHGVAIVVPTLDAAIALCDAYAPEHLELCLADAAAVAARIKNAGAIFVGGFSPEAAGDYLAGPNHVLPTGGAARYASPLGVYDFVKYVSLLALERRTLAAIAEPIERLAAVEGLAAHGRSITVRRPELPRGPLDDASEAELAALEAELAAPRWRDLIREELAASTPYRVARPPVPVVVKLDANEHPYGLPSTLAADLGRALAEVELHRYPDIEATLLRAALAEHLGVPGDHLVIGNGSDDLIRLLALTFARPLPGRARAGLATPWPSFAMFPISARTVGAELVELPLRGDFTLDVDGADAVLARARPNLAFFARPNNPTGTLWPAAELHLLGHRHPETLFVSDEAYAPYATGSMIEMAVDEAMPNLVALRTLSKLGLAALRIGCLIAPPALCAEVEKVRGPYDLGALNQRAARFVLERCGDLIAERCAEVVRERTRVSAALAVLPGVRPFDSAANFVLFRVGQPGQRRAAALVAALAAGGIAIKSFDQPGPLDGCARVTIGTPAENDRFLAAAAAALR
jgi:histidinol dehydrogenase